MTCRRALMLFLLLSCLLPMARAADGVQAPGVLASGVLVPGVYADADPAAMAWHPKPGNRGRFRELLNKEVQRHPRNVVARVQRAYLLDRAGDHARAQRDYDAALEAAAPDSVEHRHILWSRGWSRYDMGNVDAALEDWRESARRHGGRPSWVAYTFALAYWTKGDRAQALAWYDAAVDSNAKWGTHDGMVDSTRHWRPEQRERIRALFEAWAAASSK